MFPVAHFPVFQSGRRRLGVETINSIASAPSGCTVGVKRRGVAIGVFDDWRICATRSGAFAKTRRKGVRRGALSTWPSARQEKAPACIDPTAGRFSHQQQQIGVMAGPNLRGSAWHIALGFDLEPVGTAMAEKQRGSSGKANLALLQPSSADPPQRPILVGHMRQTFDSDHQGSEQYAPVRPTRHRCSLTSSCEA